MNQKSIEVAAGIDWDVATHMMGQQTPAARSAMNLLKMCVDFYEPCAMALLKQAVIDCKKEINNEVTS